VDPVADVPKLISDGLTAGARSLVGLLQTMAIHVIRSNLAGVKPRDPTSNSSLNEANDLIAALEVGNMGRRLTFSVH
jgi:hypothetical protein